MPFPAHASSDNTVGNINAATALITTDLNTVCTNIIIALTELLKAARVVYKCHPSAFNEDTPSGVACPPGLAIAAAALAAAQDAID